MNKNLNFKKLLNQPTTIAEKFHYKTKLKKLAGKKPFKFWPEAWKTIEYKGYGRFPEIKLPKPYLRKNISFKKVLLERASKRTFDKKPISVAEISSLLYYSAGLTNGTKPDIARRFYPSAGTRYPLELYLISLNTELEGGLYHYYLKHHSLEELWPIDKSLIKDCFRQNWVNQASLLLVISAFFNRTALKYGDRGYRYVLFESGHLGENLYLVSSALGLNCCSLGGFLDDGLNKLLDIDGVKEAVIYCLGIGKGKDELV